VTICFLDYVHFDRFAFGRKLFTVEYIFYNTAEWHVEILGLPELFGQMCPSILSLFAPHI
jgi:hypothetical protein